MSGMSANKHLQVGILMFPDLDQLDFTGPFEVLSRMPDASLHLLWKTTAPIKDMMGLVLQPTMALKDAPPLDVLLVPGGYGQLALMDDMEVIDYVREQGERARYVVSVCTGALILGAAGLLKGYRATTHWTAVSLLAHLGAAHVDQRVVVDRNRVTCGGGDFRDRWRAGACRAAARRTGGARDPALHGVFARTSVHERFTGDCAGGSP